MSITKYQALLEGNDNVSNKQKDDYLTEKQVAEEYPIYTVNSLRFYRSTQRSLFPFHKIGRKVFYKRDDIEKTLAKSRVEQL
jgi:hypothetical protein